MGVVSVASHVAGRRMRAMVEAYLSGQCLSRLAITNN